MNPIKASNEIFEYRIMVQPTSASKLRASVANAARGLSIKGKVDVLGDGSLEIVAQGRKDLVETLLGKIKAMPESQTVNLLSTTPISKARERFLSFQG